MDQLFELKTYEDYLESVRTWVVENALSLGISGMAQIIAVGLAFVAARMGAARVQRLLESVAKGGRYEQQLRRIAAALEPLTLPIIWLTLKWLSVLIAAQARLPYQLIKIVVSLVTAWVVIGLTTTLVRDRTWSRFIAIAAWTVAALNILLEPTTTLLDHITLKLGGLRISALTVIEAALSLAACCGWRRWRAA